MASQDFVGVESVSKYFGMGPQRVTALKDVTLSFGKGEFVCLLGPSGCGKTTLLNMLAGFEHPSAGQLHAFGIPIERPGADRTMMFQDYALFPWLTVAQNIEYGLKRQGRDKAERARVAAHYIGLIDLVGFEKKYPRQLSGGMRQRVALARALAVAPKMLLMDEPFAALDSFTRERMQDELIRVWQAERKTVVFVTHSIDEAIKLADKIVVMSPRPGRVSTIVELSDARPRDLVSGENIRIAKQIRDILHLT
jgi:NitT/TauT family transport system ATP-binding protein